MNGFEHFEWWIHGWWWLTMVNVNTWQMVTVVVKTGGSWFTINTPAAELVVLGRIMLKCIWTSMAIQSTTIKHYKNQPYQTLISMHHCKKLIKLNVIEDLYRWSMLEWWGSNPSFGYQVAQPCGCNSNAWRDALHLGRSSCSLVEGMPFIISIFLDTDITTALPLERKVGRRWRWRIGR